MRSPTLIAYISKLLWILEICEKHLVACIKLFKIRSSCENGDLPPYALNSNLNLSLKFLCLISFLSVKTTNYCLKMIQHNNALLMLPFVNHVIVFIQSGYDLILFSTNQGTTCGLGRRSCMTRTGEGSGSTTRTLRCGLPTGARLRRTRTTMT